MTEKLYDKDSHLFSFRARVTGCESAKDGWAVTLDRTAFFPEGGGQPADTGTLGEAFVADVHIKDDVIYHYVNQPLTVGETVDGEVDAEKRLRRMQNHSGEHIVSGLVHRMCGYDNVGFHMGERCTTVDFSGELSAQQLEHVEYAANAVIRDNRPVRSWYPDAEELAALDYRSKKELTGAVRLVEVKGVDLCACCAPHVSFTGEIGQIKFLSAERHRGGMRVEMLCGMDALEDYRIRLEAASEVSRLLSVPREKIASGVERVLGEQERQKERIAALSMELAGLKADKLGVTGGNHCVFDSVLDEVALRELANLLAERCGGLAAVFSGSGGEGWRYVIASRHIDLRAHSKTINAAIGGRGGGSPLMLQGRAAGTEEELRHAVNALCLDKNG